MDATQTKALLNRVRRLDIRTRRLMNDSLLGEYHSVFKGRGMDFDEVREYVAGDEVRAIDWNVTARTGHPFVKKYTEERELTLLLLIDISESGNFGCGSQSKRELAAEVASLLALSAIRNGDRVGLLLFSDRIEQYIEPRKGRRHVLRVVREILFHEAQGRGTDVLKALDVAGHLLHRRAIVFLISDFQSNDDPARARPALRRALRQTNRRHDLIAVHIEDARERELPDVGLVSLEDAETGELVELDTADRVVRQLFSAQAAAHTEELLADLRREGLDALQLATDAPYLPALQRFFKSRGRARA
jgi:uncharacterized protein (DUF58 family)